jgi:hypothetical protein
VQSFVGKFKDEFIARGASDEERQKTAPQADSGPDLRLAESLHS